MPSTVYLVSGANRGIGKLSAVKDISGHRALTSLNTGLGLVKALAARADTVVFAGARDPASASELRELADQKKNVHILKLVSCDEDGNCAAVEEIKRVAGALHVVIANAGISNRQALTLDVPPKAMLEHFDVNVNGTLVLFQSTYPLLKASTFTPKFIAVSSVLGSIAIGPTMPVRLVAYGASKAALNFVVRKLRQENEGLVAFSVCPGGVQTDMADWSLRNDDTGVIKSMVQKAGLKTVEDTVTHLLKLFDSATRETESFMNFDGSTHPW